MCVRACVWMRAVVCACVRARGGGGEGMCAFVFCGKKSHVFLSPS